MQRCLEEKIIKEVIVSEQNELDLFGKLMASGKLGLGESSAIAYAITHQCALAIDDGRAIKEAKTISSDLTIFNTQSLIVSMIKQGVIDAAQADAIKNDWAANHRFRLTINSFEETQEACSA